MRRALAPLAAFAMLAACHGDDRAPGVASPAEDRALNDAAASLDANSMEVNAVDLNAAAAAADDTSTDGNDTP